MRPKLSQLKHVFSKRKFDEQDLSNMILPVTLENMDNRQCMGNRAFNTKDYVYIDAYNDIKFLTNDERKVAATDYAMINGACRDDHRLIYRHHDLYGNIQRKLTTAYHLRTTNPKSFRFEVSHVSPDGTVGNNVPDYCDYGVVPSMHLDVKAVVAGRQASANFGKIGCVYDQSSSNRPLYHTIEFGYYPQTRSEYAHSLEYLVTHDELKPTGKVYTGYLSQDGDFIGNLEYECHHKRYVRVFEANQQCDNVLFSDGTKLGTKYAWFKVEPIKWIIRNWDDLPQSINPQGKGTAKYIDVRAEEAIAGGIPFYPSICDNNHTLWQNSTIRGFLNGIDVCRIKTNGNVEYTAPYGGVFTNNGFLQEAFVASDRYKSNIWQLVDAEKEI